MKQVIKFTDVNVDGCGTDVEVYIAVEGNAELTNDIIERTLDAIEKYKKTEECWDTDGALDVACEQLTSEGYKCTHIYPDYEIEF